MIVTSRAGPTRKRPTSSSGFCVALRPIRWMPCGRPSPRSATSASRRSSVSARCAPRLEAATAWISSTITASTPASISRAAEVRIRYSDSGVVTRMSGGLRAIAARSRCGVSPVRIATRTSSAPGPATPAQGRAQVALDVVGEGLERAHVQDAHPRLRGPRLARQAIDRPQERGERLARAGGRGQQHVLARCDRRPRAALGGGRRRERLLEPARARGLNVERGTLRG